MYLFKRNTFRYRYLIQKGAEFLNISDNFAMYNVAKAVNFLSHRGHIISLELALKHRDQLKKTIKIILNTYIVKIYTRSFKSDANFLNIIGIYINEKCNT